ncbi:hypothetical protein [Niabella hirudinis]|uniref:hypothetical protein n=1 Tax=Niabella hirudinis TaxID=1285929 RepID=UPI003EBDE0B7
MKKTIVLSVAFLLTAAGVFAQGKPKKGTELRDSIFTVMKLNDAARKNMHDLIAESGKGQNAIRKDASLTDEEKETKLKAYRGEMKKKENAILTPEQQKMWKAINAELKKRKEAENK